MPVLLGRLAVGLILCTCCLALHGDIPSGAGYIGVPPVVPKQIKVVGGLCKRSLSHQPACPTAQEDPRSSQTAKKTMPSDQGRQVVSRRILLGALAGLVVSIPSVSHAAAAGGNPSKGQRPENYQELLGTAARRAFGGGISGATAGVLQVISLMWLRTTMNYQYRFGGTTANAVKTLYEEGGVGRFYKGVGFALLQQPLSRFGDTAANTGVVMLLDSLRATEGMPLFAKTACASAAAALWRIGLMPVDTFKTTMQVQGGEGVKQLREKIRVSGLGVLYEGSAATVGSTFVGHYPWFATFNMLQASIPSFGDDSLTAKLVRNALIGLVASGVSDCCSNSLRVIKTTKQTSTDKVSYMQAIKQVVDQDGIRGLLGRGLYTRLLTNGLQGMLFSVVWKLFDELYFKKNA